MNIKKGTGKSITIFDVANYFIWFGQKHGDPVTHLKLQKLCYYAEAYYWAIYDKELTGEPFEAWAHGPVSRELWNVHRGKSWDPIIEERGKPTLPQKGNAHLDEIARVFFKFSAFELEKMTHKDYPWRRARGVHEPEDKCDTVISTEDMRKYYKRYVKE